MNYNKNKALREGAMMVALTVVLILASRYVPFLALLSSFACGVPMAALAARNGFKVTIPSLLAVFLLTALITGNIFSAVSVVLMSVLPGAVAGYTLGKKYPFFTVLFSVCLAVCAGWIFELLAASLFVGSGIDEIFAQVMEQTKAMVEPMMQSLAESDVVAEGVTAKQLTEALVQSVEEIMRFYLPSFVVFASLAEGYLIMRLCGFVIKRTKVASVNIVPFSMMKATRGMSTMAVFGWLVLLFAGTDSMAGAIFANVVLILYTIIGICGLSFVDFKLKEKIRSAWARFGIYVAVFLLGGALMSFIGMTLIIVGVLDATRDFRSLGTVGK